MTGGLHWLSQNTTQIDQWSIGGSFAAPTNDSAAQRRNDQGFWIISNHESLWLTIISHRIRTSANISHISHVVIHVVVYSCGTPNELWPILAIIMSNERSTWINHPQLTCSVASDLLIQNIRVVYHMDLALTSYHLSTKWVNDEYYQYQPLPFFVNIMNQFINPCWRCTR